MNARLLLLPLLLAACGPDETISGYADPEATYLLEEIDGAPADSVSIQFPSKGRVEGTTPCGPFTASQSAPYPWIEVSDISPTDTDCAEAAVETRFFAALEDAAIAEVSGPILILSNEAGATMSF